MSLEQFLNQPRPLEIPNKWNILARNALIDLFKILPIARANVDIVDKVSKKPISCYRRVTLYGFSERTFPDAKALR